MLSSIEAYSFHEVFFAVKATKNRRRFGLNARRVFTPVALYIQRFTHTHTSIYMEHAEIPNDNVIKYVSFSKGEY